MKSPRSLVDTKIVRKHRPTNEVWSKDDYVLRTVRLARLDHPDSIVVKELTEIIDTLRLDILEIRKHAQWVEHENEEAL